MAQRTHYQLPEPVTGYQLDPDAGWFSVLKPSAAVNLFENPSGELAITGFTPINAASSRVATEQRRGVYSIKTITTADANAGVYRQKTLVAGVHAFGVDFKGPAGRRFTLTSVLNGGAEIAGTRLFTATGQWQRLTLIAHPATSAIYRFRVLQVDALVQTFYTDGWQLEATAFPTSYFDGDSFGFLAGKQAYYWSGTPHASTSVRIFDTGSGGREMNLLHLGFRILAVAGLGLASFANVATPFSTGGAYYQTSIIQPRQFALIGSLDFTNLPDLDRARAKLIEYFNPQRLPTPQPLVLRYHRVDPCTGEETETLDIPCVYESGLEGSVDNFYQQRIPLVFKQFMPTIYADGQQGAVLGYQTTVSNFANIGYRDIDGTWKAMGTGTNFPIYEIVVGPDGSVYACGEFTLAGGVAWTAHIAKWNGTTWSALGTGTNQSVSAMAIGPDGTLYVGGLFTSAGGVANTAHIAKWDGTTWSALGTGLNNTVSSLAIGPDGSLYACGLFTLAGGVANTTHIAKWNGTTWSALGTGSAPYPDALAVGPDGTLYVGGDFASIGGVAGTAYIAKWNGTSWSALGTGTNNYVYELEIGLDGSLYAGGVFTLAGGVAGTAYIAKWNGTSWSALGTGMNSPTVAKITIGRDGIIYAGGSFTAAGGSVLPDRVAAWVGSAWIPLDINVQDVSATFYALTFGADGKLYAGGSWTGTTALSASVTTPASGDAVSYPIVTATGPGTLWQIKSYTNGDAIFFDNLTLLAGETATINTDPLNFSFVSSFRGDLTNKILSGSSPTIRLMPGANNISAFMTGTTAASAITMRWRPTYNGLDGAAR